MKFFINTTFNKMNSGIEHAQLKRAQLFRDHGEEFKLVFREWNPRLHLYLNEVGVSDDEILAMFDYFQGALHYENKIVHVEDLQFGVKNIIYEKEVENHLYLVKSGEKLIARVRYFEDDENERVSVVELFDGFNNLYRVDNYDFRGFNSLVQNYTPDNKIGSEVWYDVHGKPVIETYNRIDGQNRYTKTGWRLTYGKENTTYTFSNIDELTLHFFNLLNEEYWDDKEPNIFVLDRNHIGDWSLFELERPAYTVFHLHNSHAGDAQDPMHSVMNNFYEFGLTNANHYDAIVSATAKQTRDVKKRFKPKAKLFTIPVGVIPDKVLQEKRIPMSKRTLHSVLVTARVAPEKRIDHIIRAIGIAHEQVPDITLDFYGYVDRRNNNEAQTKIDEAIKEYHLEKFVHQYSYADNVAAIQKKSQIYGLASVMEGFNLSLMEAIGQGMVGLTYDVNYGPNELIVDGENGYVLPYDGIQEMADKLVELFTDDKKLQEMSTRSYELAERYSEENVWKAWKALLNHAKKKNISYVHEISQGLGDQRIK